MAVPFLAGVFLWQSLPDPAQWATDNPEKTAFMALKCRGECPLTWTPMERISPFLIQAVVLAEDPQFFFHKGIWLGNFWRALRINLRVGRLVWGGSSLTMQVAKNLYLSPEKSFGRKLKEILLALKIERSLEKKRILEIYLNVAQWGPSLFGIGAASRHYFGKEPAALSPFEAAYLASILPNPELAGEAGWKERFAEAGSRNFERLLDFHLMKPSQGDAKACESRLTEDESFHLDYVLARIFNAFPEEFQSGRAALLRSGEILEPLSEDERSFVLALLERVRQGGRPLYRPDCTRSASEDTPEPLPMTGGIPWASKTIWVAAAARDSLESLMHRASQEGIPLILTSGYRADGYQIFTFLNTLRSDRYCFSETMRSVALPEESEHGCLDKPAFDFSEEGWDGPFERSVSFRWLERSASSEGFHMTYPPSNLRGMSYEPWHWQWRGRP